jgi:hypothetical protein
VTCEVPERLQRKIGYQRPFERHRSSCLSDCLVGSGCNKPPNMDVRRLETIAPPPLEDVAATVEARAAASSTERRRRRLGAAAALLARVCAKSAATR